MSYRKRTLFAILLVELLLAGIWIWLAMLGATEPDRVTDDFQSNVGSIMGMAMGAIAGLGVLLYVMAARRDRA